MGPITIGGIAQYKTGRLGVNTNLAPPSNFGLTVGKNVAIGGKAYAGISTISGDLPRTLVTKDYVDAKKIGQSSGITVYWCPRSVGCDDGQVIDGSWASFGCVGQITHLSSCMQYWWNGGSQACNNNCTRIGVLRID